ncbi:unnamed protein product [Brassica oleracea var. botrytis]
MMRETQGPVFVVHVSRPAEVEQTWKDLPIIMMEQEIMETQLSSHRNYFWKDRLCHIVWLSSPVATDKRVAHELGVRLGQEVGFQVKYDKKNWLELIYQVL